METDGQETPPGAHGDRISFVAGAAVGLIFEANVTGDLTIVYSIETILQF